MRNRKLARFLAILFVAAHPCFAPAQQAGGTTEFWVAPDGSDSNPGTKDQPLASILVAQRNAREIRRLAREPLTLPLKIILRGGTYTLTTPLLVRPEDSGTETSPTIFEAAPGERPILSGGIAVTGWRKPEGDVAGLPAASRKEVWVADTPLFEGRALDFRQLYVDDRKAIRAREPDGESQERLVGWDRLKHEAWIPTRAAAWKPVPGVEMILQQQWEIAILRISSLRIQGDRAAVTFHQPESRIQFEHPYPQPVVNAKFAAAFFLANAIEFLDESGEWFQQSPGGRILYWPRIREDLAKARVIVPALENLVNVTGSVDRPVSHVHFKGISFKHTSWTRPSESGHVPLQATMFLLDAYSLKPPGVGDRKLDNLAWIGRAPAAVTVSGASHIRFERCLFQHLGASGLDFRSGTHDDVVEGCIFRDIGGNGIVMGEFPGPGVETHVPYYPLDPRQVCQNERIANNVVMDCGEEDWGAVGICVGYARSVTIEHNEISDLPYTGISVGWGWTRERNCMANNIIRANNIHHIARRLCDTAGIYTLSAQPGTVISENAIQHIRMSPYVFNPEHWFYLYLDEGSSYITVRDNWCPEKRFLKNANGPGNKWENNGPSVSEAIRNRAGLQPAFRDLLSGSITKN